MKETLGAGSDNDLMRGADDVALLAHIISKHLAEFPFSLGISVLQKSFVLAEGALDIAAPKIKTKTFPVCSGMGEGVENPGFGKVRALFLRYRLCAKSSHIVTALRPGEYISVCSQLQVSTLHSRAADLQLICASSYGRHFAFNFPSSINSR